MSNQEEIVAALRKMKRRAQLPGGPEWFFKKIGHTLQPWQNELCEAVMDVRRKAAGIETVCNHDGLNRISIRSCHGTGKTHGLAQVAHLWNFTTYGLAVNSSQTRPAKNPLMAKVSGDSAWCARMVSGNDCSYRASCIHFG